MMTIGSVGANFSEIWIQMHKLSIEENALEIVICNMSAILF